MNKLFITIIAGLLLASCQSSEMPFNRMSEQELAAYNASVEGPEQIYCIDDVRTGSFIRKRYCATVADINSALHNQANTLGVINYGPRDGRIYTPGYNQ